MAGRHRKLLDFSTGDLTVERQMQKMAEEEIVSGAERDLLQTPPPELRDKYAVATWNRITPDLLRNKTTCNLDLDNMICYCNAWSLYLESLRKLKRNKKNDQYQGMWLRRQKSAMEEQRRYGSLLGMDLNSRLKSATLDRESEKEAIEEKYGAI